MVIGSSDGYFRLHLLISFSDFFIFLLREFQLIQRLCLHSELGKDTGLAIAFSKDNVLIGFQVTGGLEG